MRPWKIIVLGASGSGKTVFLASLHHRLLTMSEGVGFFLKIDDERSRRLVGVYNQLVNPQQEWPPATDRSMVSEWKFTCCVQTEGLQSYDVLEFTYLDYAGESITDPQAGSGTTSSALDHAIRDADVFLCLLDGQKLLALMNQEPGGKDLLYKDLPNIIVTVTRSDKPVHFVITKWDLFPENDESHVLEDIRKLLLANLTFSDFVNQRTRKFPVRLIPISSVGRGFAQPQPDGQMKKTGRNPEPFQVEMPLGCVLPDLFKASSEQLDQVRKEIEDKSPEVLGKMSLKSRLAFFAPPVIRITSKIVFWSYKPVLGRKPSTIEKELVETLARFFEQGVKAEEHARQEKLKQLEIQREKSLKAIQNKKAATEYTVLCFRYLFEKLEQKFPASDFSRRI